VGVGGRGVEFLLELLAHFVADEVFDAVGWFVDVVERQAEVFDQVSFPEAVGADELAGGFAAGGSEVEAVARAGDDTGLASNAAIAD
jgi:hypothetical protein